MKKKLSLLLVFTILLFSSFYFVAPVSGATTDTQEQSFTVSPIPFWSFNEDIDLSWNEINQAVLVDSTKIGFQKICYIIGSTGAGIDYPIKFNVTYESNMDSDFEDIYFVDNDETTMLSFWLEEYVVNSWAIFWVKVADNLDTSRQIYLCYGGNEISLSDGEDTFEFFDDFEDGIFDTDKWTETASGGTLTESSGYLRVAGGSPERVVSDIGYGNSFAYMMRGLTITTKGVAKYLYAGVITTITNDAAFFQSYNNVYQWTTIDIGAEITAATVDFTTKANLEIQSISNIKTEFFHNDVSQAIHTTEETSTDKPFNFEVTGGSTTISDYVQIETVFVRKCIDSEPYSNGYGVEELKTNILEIKIPVLKYKDTKLKTMIDTDNLSGNVSFTFRGNLESNFILTYCSNNHYVYFDENYYNLTGYNLLRFEFNLKYSINDYSVEISDVESTKLITFKKYIDIYKLNNLFIFNSTGFSGSFNIYYLNGEVSYKSAWLRDTTNEDSEVYQTDFSVSIFSTEDILHSSTRSLFISGFQFWRSELGLYLFYEDYKKVANGDKLVAHHEITFQFYYPNDTELYRVVFFVNATGETQPVYVEYHTDVLVYYHDELIWSCPRATYNRVPIDLYDGEMRLDSKVALWRTQEDNLALKVNGDMNYYINGAGKDNFTYWQSDISLENYQCNISVYYEIETEGLNTFNVDIVHGYTEYYYNTLDGCVEPHFSTTWWEDIPVINAIINGFIWVGNMIISGLGAIFRGVVAGAVSLLSPLITGITSAVNAVAGAVWNLFSGAIAGITSAVNAVAGGIWALFSATLGVISTGISDIVSGMTGWVSDAIEATLIFVLEEGLGTLLGGLIDALASVMITIADSLGAVFGIANLGTSIESFFGMFSSTIGAFLAGFGIIINYGVSTITLVVTYATLFAPSGLTILGIFIIIDITDALLDNKLYKFEKYLLFFQWCLDIMFKIVNAFVQFIGGIIP